MRSFAAGWRAAGVLGAVLVAVSGQAQSGTGAADSFAAPVLSRPADQADTRRPDVLPRARYAASPLLDPGHWAVRAAVRAEAMGLADGWLPAQRAVPRAQVETALRAAALRAQDDPRWAALTRGWLERFVREFPEYADGADARPAGVLGSFAGAGYASAQGRVAPSIDMAAPLPLADREGAAARLSGGVRLGRGLAGWAEAASVGDDVDLPRWNVTAGAGAFALSAGRETEGYGVGRNGGVVYSGAEPLPRLELSTTRALHLPGVLGVLGGVGLHTFGSRTVGPREPGRPWLWGARLSVQPHRRLTVAINRGSLFGGEPGDPVTAANLARMFVGVVRTEFDNQAVSMDFRWRLPTERTLPATLYLEWGADDGAGAVTDVPGTVAGIYLPSLPAIPALALGAEFTRFGRNRDGNGSWYRHNIFRGNWARGDAVLGHPLGGEGHEGLVYGEADLPGSRVWVQGSAFVRRRASTSEPANLFGPERLGRSRGGSMEVLWRMGRRAEASATVRGEAGDGWSQRDVTTELRVRP